MNGTVFSGAAENDADRAVAALDPLGADQIMSELPAANRQTDTAWLRAMLAKLGGGFDTDDVLVARAALRDLGFLAASMMRHAPDADLSFIEPTLRRLATVAGEAPRDTVYSYTTRNPDGPRRRSFVGSEEEDLFINSVAAAIRALNVAVEHLAACRLRPDLNDQDVLTALGQAHVGIEALRQNLRTVQRVITPEYFSHQMRPYFPQMTIDGRTYMGPGGAQMPLLVLDVMLLTPGEGGPLTDWHDVYIDENVAYLPPTHRAVCAETLADYRSGRSRLLAKLNGSPRVRDERTALLKRILRFRHPHRQLARANMALRAEGSLGSGGYTVEALDRLIEINTVKATAQTPAEAGTEAPAPLMKVEGFAPVRVGAVRGRTPQPRPVSIAAGRVRLRYPTRLNAMALDPSKVLPGSGSYPAGELLFVADLFTPVEITMSADGHGVSVAAGSARPILARHAAMIMRQVLGLRGSLLVKVGSNPGPAHVGLGSSSATIAAVAAAINELCGRPLDNRTLMRLLVDNHGEEIDGVNDMVMPVQCIGGSAAAGLASGAIQVVAGNAVALLAAPAPAGHTLVLAVPPDPRGWDASGSLAAEAENFGGFLETGRLFAPEIAYRLVHQCWPDLVDGQARTLGQLVFDYRFDMGSIRNCAFSHPRLLEHADAVRGIFESGQATVLSLSSVGPLFFALTEDPDGVEVAFTRAGLNTIRANPWDKGYVVDEHTVE